MSKDVNTDICVHGHLYYFYTLFSMREMQMIAMEINALVCVSGVYICSL